MIKEEAKLGIAMDAIANKIANQTVKIRNNQNNQEELEKELQDLLNQQKQVYANNYDVINKIIEDMENSKND